MYYLCIDAGSVGEIDKQPDDYLCQACGKSFASSVSLKEHSMVHTGEKAFQCELCEKRFARKALLRKHMRTKAHRPANPYHCEPCGKWYSIYDSFQKHLLNHTKVVA